MKISNSLIFGLILCFSPSLLTYAYGNPAFLAAGELSMFNQQTGQSTSQPVIYSISNEEENWRPHVLDQAEQHKTLTSISCTRQYCTAIGQDYGKPIAYTSDDGGIKWVFHHLNQLQNDALFSLACSGDKGQYCIAAGRLAGKAAIFRSVDRGLHWTSQILGKEGDISYFAYISCSGTNNKYCMVLGHYREKGIVGKPMPYVKSIGFRTDDGGLTWTEMYIPHFDTGDTQILSVSCNGVSGQYCTAVGHWMNIPITYTTTNGGFNWTPNVLPHQEGWRTQLKTVSCTGDYGQYCTAIGESNAYISKLISYSSTDGGFTWTSYLINGPIYSNNQLNEAAGITCYGETGQTCLMIGNTTEQHDTGGTTTPISFISNDGGTNWIPYHFHNTTPGMKVRSISQGAM